MSSSKRIITAAAILAGLLFSTAVGEKTPRPKKLSPDEILNARTADCFTHVPGEDVEECLRVRKVTVPGLLNDALGWRQIRVGFVPADFSRPQAHLDVNPSSLFVRDVLNSIVAADRRYKWSVEDGVVVLQPAAGRPPLLDVRLAEFREKGTSAELFGALELMPEVSRRATELGFSGGKWAAGGFGLGFFTGIREITCRNCTVLEVLNEIARQSGSSWMYREISYDGEKYFHFSYLSSD
ncbi:MAG TPA: hypothetical protein VD861_17515 [Pyrinomonadaceae bacterium]|nr:hypothetical protein [Pyrinomonadaceae bacterium]